MDFKIGTDPIRKTAYIIENKVGGGSVTLANMRLSLANGVAFVDFSAAGALAPYALPGAKLVVIDSAGNKAVGYIQQAGTGETYGPERFTNHSWDVDTTGWTVGANALLTSVAGGQSNNCLRVTENGTANPYAGQQLFASALAGALYKSTLYVKAGTSSIYRWYLQYKVGAYFLPASIDRTAPVDWEQQAFYYAYPSDGTQETYALMNRCAAGSGYNLYFDEVSCKQVLAPSPTGVTIVSAAGGATRNWASIDAAFNYNSAAGYTYEIYAPAYTEVYIPGATILSQHDVVDQRGQMTFDQAGDGNLMNNVYLSLMTRRGSFFLNPAFGSRLHLLQRAKNTERTAALAAEYCKEALQWLIDTGRATKIDVQTERDRTADLHRLKAIVEVTKASGEAITFTTFVEVV